MSQPGLVFLKPKNSFGGKQRDLRGDTCLSQRHVTVVDSRLYFCWIHGNGNGNVNLFNPKIMYNIPHTSWHFFVI